MKKRRRDLPSPSSAAAPGVSAPSSAPDVASSSVPSWSPNDALADAWLFCAVTIALSWLAPVVSPFFAAMAPAVYTPWGDAAIDGLAQGALIGLGQVVALKWRGHAKPLLVLFSAVAFALAHGVFAGITLLVAPWLVWLALGGLVGAAWSSALPSESPKALVPFVAGVAAGFAGRELLSASPGSTLEIFANALPGTLALPGAFLAWRAAAAPAD